MDAPQGPHLVQLAPSVDSVSFSAVILHALTFILLLIREGMEGGERKRGKETKGDQFHV